MATKRSTKAAASPSKPDPIALEVRRPLPLGTRTLVPGRVYAIGGDAPDLTLDEYRRLAATGMFRSLLGVGALLLHYPKPAED